MLSPMKIGAAVAGVSAVLALTACVPAAQDGPRPSATFTTLPSPSTLDEAEGLYTSEAMSQMQRYRTAYLHCSGAADVVEAAKVYPTACNVQSGMLESLPPECTVPAVTSKTGIEPFDPTDVRKCARALAEKNGRGTR